MLDLRDPMFNRFGSVNVLNDLIDQIRDNKVIPFVGAGMTIDIYGSWGSALMQIMDGNIFKKITGKNLLKDFGIGLKM